MAEVSFADGFDTPDRIAFGLAAPQLAVAAAGTAIAYLIAQSPIPVFIRVPLAGSVLIAAGLLAWGRVEQRPVLDWAVLMARFLMRPHGGAIVVSARSRDGHDQPIDDPITPVEFEPAVSEPVPDAGPAPEPAPPGEPGSEPPWARWLRIGPSPPDTTWAALGVEESPPDPIAEVTGDDPDRPPHAAVADDDNHRAERTNTVEMTRTPLVLLPTPVGAGDDAEDDAEDDDDSAAELPEGELELPDDSPGPHPVTAHRGWPDETPAGPLAVVPDPSPAPAAPTSGEPAEHAPVFVGATRRITFFSLNGGAGRTTLATEVACLLAANGRHRSGPNDPPRRLRIALLDLDLRSATVAVHLGIPQPTVWDYMVSGGDPTRIEDFMVSHPSGVRALLGPPKPLTSKGATLEPARVAEIVHQLERDGAHFIIIDVSGDLNAVTTWVLSAVHDIYVVLTPTASGVQDAYRTTESLRRLGLAGKLRYVVNRSRGPVDLRETMNDLGGRIVATIPYDACVEDAENNHRIAALDKSGPAVDGIHALAAHIFPGLGAAAREGRLARLLRWHRAG